MRVSPRCTRVPVRVSPVSVSTRFSLRREFVTASRLFAISPSHFIPLVSAYPASLSSFLRQVYRDPILLFLSLSLNVLLSGDASKVTGARVPAARRRIPAGPIHPWGTLPTNPVASVERHAHIHRPSRSAGKLLLSRESQDNFASGSRERTKERFLEFR